MTSRKTTEPSVAWALMEIEASSSTVRVERLMRMCGKTVWVAAWAVQRRMGG